MVGRNRIRQHALQQCLPLSFLGHTLCTIRDSIKVVLPNYRNSVLGMVLEGVFRGKCRRSEMTEMSHYTGTS